MIDIETAPPEEKLLYAIFGLECMAKGCNAKEDAHDREGNWNLEAFHNWGKAKLYVNEVDDDYTVTEVCPKCLAEVEPEDIVS